MIVIHSSVVWVYYKGVQFDVQKNGHPNSEFHVGSYCAVSACWLLCKALHPPTQSIASANAKHCIRQRKALHLPTQSFASAYAKLCIRLRKALLEKAPSFRIIYFMTVNAKHCDFPCKRILVNALLFRNPLNFRNKSIHGFLDKN